MRTNVPGGIRVVGISPEGARIEAGRLAHGQHPAALLALHGLAVEKAWAADVLDDGALELAYHVSRLSGIRPRGEDVPRDADVAPDEAGDPYQRVAAYAIVESERGLLLTQFNALTHVAGEWGLPGGGLDAGESPAEGGAPGGVGGDRAAHRPGGARRGAVVALDRAGAQRCRRGLPRRAHRLPRDVPRAARCRHPRRRRHDRRRPVGADVAAGALSAQPDLAPPPQPPLVTARSLRCGGDEGPSGVALLALTYFYEWDEQRSTAISLVGLGGVVAAAATAWTVWSPAGRRRHHP